MLDDAGLRRHAEPFATSHRWYSSGDVDWFRRLGSQLLGPELDTVEAISWH
jgi:hypothetical protein